MKKSDNKEEKKTTLITQATQINNEGFARFSKESMERVSTENSSE